MGEDKLFSAFVIKRRHRLEPNAVVHAWNCSTQEAPKFKATLGYIGRLCLKKKRNSTDWSFHKLLKTPRFLKQPISFFLTTWFWWPQAKYNRLALKLQCSCLSLLELECVCTTTLNFVSWIYFSTFTLFIFVNLLTVYGIVRFNDNEIGCL